MLRATATATSLLVAGLTFAGLTFSAVTAQAQHGPADEKKSTPTVNWHGWAQIDLRHGQTNDKALVNRDLSVAFARLGARGKIVDDVTYGVLLQLDRLDDVGVLDTYADITLKPWAHLKVGQFKYEFDYAGRESNHGRPLPDQPWATSAVGGALNGAGTATKSMGSWRDRGLSLIGQTMKNDITWKYGVGVFQGNGRTTDNNNDYALTANLRMEHGSGFGWNIGFLRSDTADQATDAADDPALDSDYRAWTVGGVYDHDRVFVRGEYYAGSYTIGATDTDRRGGYALAGFRLATDWDALVRYQFLEDERYPAGDDRADGYDLALRYFLKRQERWSGTSVDLNYQIRDADDGFSGLTLLNTATSKALASGNQADEVLTLRLRLRF